MRLRNLTNSPYSVDLVDGTVVNVPAFDVSDDIEPSESFLAGMNTNAWAIATEDDDATSDDETVDGGDGDEAEAGDENETGNDTLVGDGAEVGDAGDSTVVGSDQSTAAGDDGAGDDTVAGDSVVGDGGSSVVSDAGETGEVNVNKLGIDDMRALLDKENIFYTPDMGLKKLREAYIKFKKA